jgi:hypothetical protein
MDESSALLLHGKLLKRDRAFPTWKLKEFYLERHRLLFFSEKGTRKGEIMISSKTPISIHFFEDPKPFGFVLFIRDERLILCAPNENERKRWIGVFTEVFHADVQKGRTHLDSKAKPTFLPVPIVNPSLSVNSAESYIKFGSIREWHSGISFPPNLSNGDLLTGVGPIVRRMGWIDERILAVGMYIDYEGAIKELECYSKRSALELYGDQTFYDAIIQSSFRRTFVITSRKRVSKSVLITVLHDELSQRMSGDLVALKVILGFVEKSLKKATSMVFTCNSNGTLEFRLRGAPYPPISSPELCKCLQSLFFDATSIQYDAKRGLIDRIPSLLGDRDEIYANHTERLVKDRPNTNNVEYGEIDNEETEDDIDEHEHELLRRESRCLDVQFGPLVDLDTELRFEGQFVDDSVLLGTWTIQDTHVGPATIALYVSASGAIESLLKFKGLSVGSIIQDPEFFQIFIHTNFSKHILIRLTENVALDELTTLLKDRCCQGHCTHDEEVSLNRDFELILSNFFEFSVSQDDILHFAISDSGATTFTREVISHINLSKGSSSFSPTSKPKWDLLTHSSPTKRSASNGLEKSGSQNETYRHSSSSSLLSTSFGAKLQNTLYGYSTSEVPARSRLLERLPRLLDLATDTLVHTYHDEIQMLRENYRRQRPESRVKVGYLFVSVEKKSKMQKSGGQQSSSATRWSRRWCRLDGIAFSYYSHKRKNKPRQVIDLTLCKVSDMSDIPLFMEKRGRSRPSIKIAIKTLDGLILGLRTESIFEGADWLEALGDASRMRRNRDTNKPSFLEMLDESGAECQPDVELGTVPTNRELKRLDFAKNTPGSLIGWIQEDPRNLLIFLMLTLIVWLVSERRKFTMIILT